MRGYTTLYWLLTDHLGGTANTINGGGTAEVAELRYRAFGATPTTYRFTGQREESTIGLYFCSASWYDALLGRFVQADSVGGEDPQATRMRPSYGSAVGSGPL